MKSSGIQSLTVDEPLFLATRTIDYWSSDEEKRILISIADFENWSAIVLFVAPWIVLAQVWTKLDYL